MKLNCFNGDREKLRWQAKGTDGERLSRSNLKSLSAFDPNASGEARHSKLELGDLGDSDCCFANRYKCKCVHAMGKFDSLLKKCAMQVQPGI